MTRHTQPDKYTCHLCKQECTRGHRQLNHLVDSYSSKGRFVLAVKHPNSLNMADLCDRCHMILKKAVTQCQDPEYHDFIES